MPALLSATRVKGLVLGIDRKQVGELHCVDGRNFIVTAEGPKSYFGADLAAYKQIFDAENVVTFRVENDILFFTENSILRYNHEAQIFVPVFAFAVAFATHRRWFSAIVGGEYFFARRGVAGILRYNPVNDTWDIITTDVVTNPSGVTQANGRLVIIGDGVTQWSAIDDGADLATSTSTGAGAQSLAIIGGGTPIAVFATNDGFISFTTRGLMKSEVTNVTNPFRHRRLSITEGSRPSRHIPLDEYSVIEVGTGEIVMLTRNGLYRTTGEIPQPYQPLFSEFCRNKLFPALDLSIEHIFALTYNSEREFLFISVSNNLQPHVFDKAYVLYVPADEFGSFDREHSAIIEFPVPAIAGHNIYPGFITSTGWIYRFQDYSIFQPQPDFRELFHVHSPYQFPARLENDVVEFSSVIRMRTIDKNAFSSIPGVYYQNTFEVYIPESNDMNSFVTIGTFRQTNEMDVDAFSYINNIALGMIESPEIDTFIDYNLFEAEIFEDWNVGDDIFEDWGSGTFSGVVYDVVLRGTLDGYNNVNDTQENLMELAPSSLLDQMSRVRFYDAYTYGVYFLLDILAIEAGKSFHLKTMDASATLAGRM